jgi:D-alanyl-D-alanine carboxypeptidase/D-alanyl-D-alanine-endopeptidase (penicillin-binding protein 4)
MAHWLLWGLAVALSWARANARDASPAVITADNSYAFLGQRLERSLANMDWGGGKLALLVEDAELPIRVLALNEDEPQAPGALMQIATAAAALDVLGPDHRFSTELYLTGAQTEKTLEGALIVRGSGDPTWSGRYLTKDRHLWRELDGWAEAVRDKGIRRIDGPVVADARAFDNRLMAAGWAPDPLGAADCPPVAAVNFNHNCVRLELRARRGDGKPVSLRVFPMLADYIFVANKLKSRTTPLMPFNYERVADGNLITLTGDMTVKTGRVLDVAIEDPGRFFAEALKARLIRAGVEVTGPAASSLDPNIHVIPEERALLASRISPPLAEILGRMMREDRTLEAETVFKTLGRRGENGQSGSFAHGAHAVAACFDKLCVNNTGGMILDGSGRSTLDRLTARQILELMRAMSRHPQAAPFAALFPRPGEPGILADRFKPEIGGAAPDLQAKTGSGEGQEAVAGWVRAANGRRMLFVIMVTQSRAPAAVLRGQLDRLVLELATTRLDGSL